MNHNEMIAVIQAHKNGENIQTSVRHRQKNIESWRLIDDNAGFNFISNNYRVKPAKKVLYIAIDDDADAMLHYIGETKKEAMNNAGVVLIACIRIEYEDGQFDD